VAPRAYWKGYLKLSLVSCPVALFPASSEREKISFNQINKKTGNRIRYRKVDAETGDEVDSSDIIKGYEVGKGQYIEIEPEELGAIAIESKRTIEIDEFVPKKEIDELYLNSPYYLVPDGEVGQQAFAVIREAIRKEGMVALGRVVFTSREHVITLEARGKGLLGMTLRYPYEVRKEGEYFEDIPDEKIPKDMLELASHIVETKSGHFNPEEFEDHYEDALKELLKKKQAGEKIEAPKERAPAKVINLPRAACVSARAIQRRARSILKVLCAYPLASRSSTSAARANVVALAGCPRRAASACGARHGLCATPPSAKRPSLMVSPSSSSPTATETSANAYESRSRIFRYV
jgi:DNA end-binding protein Ku